MMDDARIPTRTQVSWSYRPAVTRVTSLLLFAATAALLWWGWSHRSRYYVSPEEGLGYLLGIVGGSLMLLLGLYPLRKHLRWMRNWGAVRHWFRVHMVFGIAGPVAILFHSNFGTGAMNSNMALYSMLIVSTSGLVGRYLYARIHEGLYGRHLEISELRRAWMDARARLDLHAHHLDAIGAEVDAYERPLLTVTGSLRTHLWQLPASAWRRRKIIRRAQRVLAQSAAEGEDAPLTVALLHNRLSAAAAAYRYAAFDRLFGLWHLLHLPLYLMLIVTGVIHVVAVHMY